MKTHLINKVALVTG
jgi:dehydrogenase/reductase SDR family protein 1